MDLVELAAGGQLISDVGFLNTDTDGKSWVGFTLDSAHWRRGYAREAVGAVLGLYARLGVAEAWASVDPQNDASARLLEGLGFSWVSSTDDDRTFRVALA